MNRAQRRKAESESRRRPDSSDDPGARPPLGLAEAIKAAGLDPNFEFNGLPSPWKRDDAAWFEAHPQRAHRVRDRLPGERFDGETSAPPNAAIIKVVIRQIRPGLRAKAAFTMTESSDPDDIAAMRELFEIAERTETVAHALFDSPGQIDFPELLARINQHEAASMRAVN